MGKKSTSVKYNPKKFKQLCQKHQAGEIFDTIFEAILPSRQDRTTAQRRTAAERHTMVIMHIMCYSQSERCNYLQRDLSNFLHYHGLGDTGLFALHEMALGIGHTTFYRNSHQAQRDHASQVKNVIANAVKNKKLMVVIIDDFTNVHTWQQTNATMIAHMATILVRIFDIPAVPANVNGQSVNDPIGVDIVALTNLFYNEMETILKPFVTTAPAEVQQQFFNPQNERNRLTTHMYGNNNDVRQMRCV